MQNGDYFGSYHDPEVAYREMARHLACTMPMPTNATRADTMRQCRFIRDFLLRTAPDPTSFKPRRPAGVAAIGKKFLEMGEDRMYETIRFWTMSVAEYLDEYFESDIIKAALSGQRHHRHGARRALAGHGLRAAASLHGRRRRQRRQLGLCPRRHGGGSQTRLPARSRPTAARFAPIAGVDKIIVKERQDDGRRRSRTARRSTADIVVSAMDVKRTFLKYASTSRTCRRSSTTGSRTSRFAARRASSTSPSTACPSSRHLPKGSSLYHSDMHFIDSMAHGARLRRLEGRDLVEGSVCRHGDARRPIRRWRRRASTS